MSKTSICEVDYVLVAPGYTHRLLKEEHIKTIRSEYFDFMGVDDEDEEDVKENDDVLFISYYEYDGHINETPRYKEISSKKKDIEYLKTVISKYKIYQGCVAFGGAGSFDIALLYADTLRSIDFCGCFSPRNPYSVDYIDHLGNKVLVLHYDTESG